MIRLFAVLSFVLLTAMPVAPIQAQALLNAPPLRTATEVMLSKVESVPQLLAMGKGYLAKEEWQNYEFTMKRVLELRPFAGNIRVELAAAYAMQDRKQDSFDILVRMQSTGYAWDLAADERFANLHPTRLWDYLVKNYKANALPFGEGKVAFEMPKDDLLLESLGYDAKRKQFLTGSVRTGQVFRVDAAGKLTPFIEPTAENGLWGVFNLVADSDHDLLWVASAAIVHVKHAKGSDYGRAGVFKFRLSDGKFIGKYILPTDGRNHLLTSIASNPRGDVFVSDGLTRQIFKVEGDSLRLVVQNPKLTSIRGLAATDDNKILYFSDYELGVFGLDLNKGTAFDVLTPENLTLFSIEDLGWYQGHLVAIQNGFPPNRVMRFGLSDDRHVIREPQGLDVNHPAITAPTRGVVVGDKYYFIANSQKAKYDQHGLPSDAAKLEPVRVFVSDIRFGMKGGEAAAGEAPKAD